MQHIDITTKILVYTIEESEKKTKKIIEKAQNSAKMAYAPYSDYRVGAAILLSNGEIITGNNQENAAYPSGLCAERTAVFYANSQYSNTAIEAIAIVAFNKGDFTETACVPCGACRQALLEMEQKNNQSIKVLMCSRDKVYEAASVSSLLPLAFSKDCLDK